MENKSERCSENRERERELESDVYLDMLLDLAIIYPYCRAANKKILAEGISVRGKKRDGKRLRQRVR